MRYAFIAVALVGLAACDKPYDNGYAVDLIVESDGSLSSAELMTAKIIDFVVTGAETAMTTYQLDRPFASGDERVIYRPAVMAGELTFAVTARDAAMATLGSAVGKATLEPGKTVTLHVRLAKPGSGGDGGMMSGGLLSDRSSFDFGTFVSGQSATPHTFTITNDSKMASGPLTSALAGVDLAAFKIEGDTCAGKMLASGASCTLAIRLGTTTVGTPTASLVVSGAPPGSATIVLTGTIVAPGALSIAPVAGDFGSVAQAQTSTAQSFVVQNNGGSASGPLTVMIVGDDASMFSTPSGCAAMALNSGATCMVTVSFSPTASAALGMKTASITVSGSPGGLAAAELRGSVIKPGSIGISPGFYDLGKIKTGQVSATVSYVVTNTGQQPTGALGTVKSGNADQFEVVSDQCQGQVLAGSATCMVSVRFKPTQAGNATLVLAISATPGGTVPATAFGIAGDFVTLTLTKTGTGAVSAPGISCGADCTELYDRNATIVLSALPDMSTRFGMWGGAPCAGSKLGTCTVMMDTDKTLTASFVARNAANFAFVTSTTIIPKDLGAAGVDPLLAADAVCKNRALQGGLPGTYKAYLATTAVSAISRLGAASGWIRTDGQPFAATLASLTAGKILYPLRIDELGTAVADDPMNTAGTANVATGADKAGASLAPNCTNWSAAGTFVFGYTAGATDLWASINNNRDCALPTRLYCFETSFTTGVTVTAPAAFRRVFLTQNTYQPPINGIGDGDNICTAEKNTFLVTSGGSGTYKALLAQSGSLASLRFNPGLNPWVRPDGVQVSTTAATLFTDSLAAAINVTANGTYIGATNAEVPFAMIGTANGITTNGVASENCGNWNGGGGGAEYGGRISFADKNWSIGDNSGCSHAVAGTNLSRIICLEE